MRHFMLIAATVLLFLHGCRQKDGLTQFRESVHVDKALYFEPSTLRMANLQNNPEFDEMVKELEKALYLRVVKNGHTDSAVDVLRKTVHKEGYEELLTFKDKKTDVSVFVLDRKIPTILSIALTDTVYNIVEMRGMINLIKVPQILESFNNNEFQNILSLTDNHNQKKRIEPDTTDQQPE